MTEEFAEILSRLECTPSGESSWRCRCPVAANHGGWDKNPSASVFVGRKGDLIFKCFKGCTLREATKAIGIPIKNWNREIYSKKESVIKMEYNQYPYYRPDGELSFTVFRSKPPHKIFFQQRVLRDKDGKKVGVSNTIEGGFFVKKAGNLWEKFHGSELPAEYIEETPCPKLLYRMNDVVEGEPIFVVEGEGKVEAIRDLGMNAVCASGGAMKFSFGVAKMLIGRSLIIIPDHDKIGWEHAALVYGMCAISKAKDVRVLDLSKYFPMAPKDDVKDVLKQRKDECTKLLKCIYKGASV